MKLQRCQRGEVLDPFDFRIDSNGACGPGLYAMLFGDRPMQRYYSKLGELTYSFEVPDKYIKHLKGISTYWVIRETIERYREGGYKVFICKHKGIGIPTSKQVVIIDPSIITNIKKEL
jgi:hypothetical protein